MQHFTISKEIDVSHEQAWEILKDFKNIHYFNPFITSVYLISYNDGGEFSKRICYVIDGSTLNEKVINLVEGEKYEVIVENSIGPVYNCHTSLSLKSNNGKNVEMTIKLNYNVHFGIFGKIIDKIYIKKRMKKDFIHLINGLELYSKLNKKITFRELKENSYLSS